MINSKSIGNKIAESRKNQNISQAQLAEKLFISPQAVGKWERGESLPDIIMLARLAEELNIDIQFLIGEPGGTHHEDQPDVVIKEHDLPVSKKLQKKGWNMSRGNWVKADFSGLKNLNEKFDNSNLNQCNFSKSEMSNLSFKNNMINTCVFDSANLSGALFNNSHIGDSNFKLSLMQDASFDACYVQNCDFSGANLSNAKFDESYLTKLKLEGAILDGISFNNSHLYELKFQHELNDCVFENSSFTKVIFENAILKNTFFKGRRLKQIKFINCKADRLTYEVLKAGKADMSGIELLKET